MTMLANVERLAHEALAAGLRPPEPIDYLAFAERHVVISDSPLGDRYVRSQFPFFDEILRALSPADPCRTVTVCASAQIGKTTLANVFAYGSLVMGKGNVLYVLPTEDAGRRWSRMKLGPMMRATPILRENFPQRSKDAADSVMFKERRDGLSTLLITGANSPAALSQVTIHTQVQDDLAKWPTDNIAGDPEVQADSRSRAIEFAKILKASTPLIEGSCRITRNFEQGSREMPYVLCVHCQHPQVLEPDNFLAALDPERPEDACFTCVSCGGAIEERHRPQMLASFEWRAQNPAAKSEHRSFWLWSAYSPLQSWPRIAREYLKVRGDPAGEQVFLNDTCGKAYRALGEAPPWENLRNRAASSHYVRGTVPPGALVLMAGVDCQADYIAVQIIGFGAEYRRFVVDYIVIERHISDPDCQRNLDLLLSRTWGNHVGCEMAIDFAAIDGNAWTEDVWSFAQRHPSSKLIMVRGRGDDNAPRLALVKRERNPTTGKLLKYSKRFYHLGVSGLKMALYRDLQKVEETDRGFVHFPSGVEDSYYQELTSERREAVKRHGFTVYRWTKDARQRNEALDTMVIATGAAIKFGVYGISDKRWKSLAQEREVPHMTPLSSVEKNNQRILRIIEKLPT
jgi:phage terminase large subunit GpA-like protein